MTASLRPDDPVAVGPYRLTGRLGAGGMGTVFLGAADDGRAVAVKVINAGAAGDPQFRARFRREVEAARLVRRFCTAPVLDASVEDEPFYIVTEHVAGPTLEEAVVRGGVLRGADLEALAVGTATALAAIHDAGLVHRDLKPSNVLLSAFGPRVIDFGIARALDSGAGLTRAGQLIGTPSYMAPEIIKGDEPSAASDVFSWACVIAFAGTGRGPFEGGTMPEILYRISHDPPRLDGLDPALLPLVSRALTKDPSRRPTIGEVLTAFTGTTDPGFEAVGHLHENTLPSIEATPTYPTDAPPPAAPTPLRSLPNTAAPLHVLPDGSVPGWPPPDDTPPAPSLPNTPLREGPHPNKALRENALPDEALPEGAPPDEALRERARADEALPALREGALPDAALPGLREAAQAGEAVPALREGAPPDEALRDRARADEALPGLREGARADAAARVLREGAPPDEALPVLREGAPPDEALPVLREGAPPDEALPVLREGAPPDEALPGLREGARADAAVPGLRGGVLHDEVVPGVGEGVGVGGVVPVVPSPRGVRQGAAAARGADGSPFVAVSPEGPVREADSPATPPTPTMSPSRWTTGAGDLTGPQDPADEASAEEPTDPGAFPAEGAARVGLRTGMVAGVIAGLLVLPLLAVLLWALTDGGDANGDAPAPQSASLLAVPDAFLGTWRGEVVRTGDKKAEYPVTVTLTGGALGERIGTSEARGCTRDLTLTKADGVQLLVIESGTGQGCAGAAPVTLSLTGADLVYGLDDGATTAVGALTR
ncbi:serine/threonine-protein kinase [Actinocorallia sp. A-T 12471]|uniref:serine/threonine-protein kinase n=1 Tax=Actinocorallia sp. A-T 12471 TaxID=3089813 RepID=UPI0029CCF6C3|nr:protein kinase [Actinocorallia sp. A-T 12471]MDX6743421.1 protein kinase [Actinocorallia sp. A-T 12471]